MKRLYLLVLLIAVAMCVYPAGKNVLDVQVGDSSGVAYFDSVRLVYLYGGAAYSGDSVDATYLIGDTIYGTYVNGTLIIIDSTAIDDAVIDSLDVNEVFTVSTSTYTVDADGKQSNTHLTLDSLLITDSGGADSLLAYDDSDTFRIVVDNPLKLTGSLIFTDFVFGSGTFGTGKTADTIENTAIAAGDYAFITWTSATDSVYEVGGGYHVTILEDSIIVTTSFEETGTTYDYLVK